GGHRRPRQHAGRVRRRAYRRLDEGQRHRDLPRGRDAGGVRRRHCRAGPASGWTLRTGHRVMAGPPLMARAIAGLLAVALLVAPLVLPRYQITLLLPSFAYGIALLGLNLLFGTTGLLSFGHALFVALGAYTAAYLTTGFGVRHFELIVVGAALVAVVVAVPVGLLCVRYVKIYFGMLTLAFGMLF